jgi:NADH-quinone oxidoreductase subunit N
MFEESFIRNLSDKLNHILGDMIFMLPEITLGVFFLLLIVIDLIFKKNRFPVIFTAFVGITFTLGWELLQFLLLEKNISHLLFFDTLHLNKSILFFKIFFSISAFLTLLISFQSTLFKNTKQDLAEYIALVFAILLGLHFLVMSVNFLMIYLSLELISISSYILTAFHFHRKSAEGSIKYLLFGAFASGLMLYGMSWLYGLKGDLSLLMLGNIFELPHLIVFIALFLTLAGVLFKISVVPFHIWTPDIYEAAPTPIVAFFSVAPKAGGLLVLLRFTTELSSSSFHLINYTFSFQAFLAVLAMASLTVGNFSALWQNNAKRLLAYSAIAQAGFLLIPVISLSSLGIQSLIFYLIIYLLMSFGAFLWVEMLALYLYQKETLVYEDIYDIRNYQGLGKTYPYLGVCILVLMLSLIGLPPTAGFTAKLLIFSALWESYQQTQSPILLALWIFGLLNTLIALAYYIKIPYYLFFGKSSESSPEVPYSFPIFSMILLSLFTFGVLFFFFQSGILFIDI